MIDDFTETDTAGGRRFSCLSIVNHKSSIVNAQEIPVVGRPTEHFYGAAGRGVQVTLRPDKLEVPEDGEIVATLTATNVTNPRQVTRPDLKKLDDFHALWVITDNADAAPDAQATEVKFTYRLRPRNRKTDQLPVFVFHYFNPAAAAGKQFMTAKSKPIPITVTAAAPKAPPPAIPMTEPDHLFAVANGPELLDNRPLSPTLWSWLVLGVAGPVLAVGWYAAWRWTYPGAAKLAQRQRSKAARRASEAIRRAGHAPDPPAAIAAAVLGYLRARFPLPIGAVTPSEVGAALGQLGLPQPECDAVADVLRECDAARFSPASDIGVSLASDAEALVARLEAA